MSVVINTIVNASAMIVFLSLHGVSPVVTYFNRGASRSLPGSTVIMIPDNDEA